MTTVSEAIAATQTVRTQMVELLARDATAFAYGNGYTDLDTVNAIVHAHVSAQMTYLYGPGLAEDFGDAKEIFSHPGEEWDSLKDHTTTNSGA
jgi:hypothetical protein